MASDDNIKTGPMTGEQILEEALRQKRKAQEYLIALPFEEKIRRVIEMQRIERDLKRDPSKKVYVWNL